MYRYVAQGDASGDGKVTAEDLMLVQAHILGIITLSGDRFLGADTNGDGAVTTLDLAKISSHIAGAADVGKGRYMLIGSTIYSEGES